VETVFAIAAGRRGRRRCGGRAARHTVCVALRADGGAVSRA